jgi:hypothetical protein
VCIPIFASAYSSCRRTDSPGPRPHA